MTTDNRRKEEKSKANAAGARRNLDLPPHSAMVDKAEKETSHLPSKECNVHIATIENVVSTHNMMEAYKAVKRNDGAPGIDGISTEEIREVIQENWPKIKQDILEGKYVPSPV